MSEEKRKEVSKSLADFVIRVASHSEKASPAELAVIPEIAKLLLGTRG